MSVFKNGVSEVKRLSATLAVARMDYEQGDFESACAQFTKALHLAEENSLPEELKARALVGLAKSTAARGRFDEAQRFLEQALLIDESDTESLVEEAEDYHQLSLLYWRNGRPEEAYQVAQKAWNLVQQSSDMPDELVAKLLKHFASLSEQKGDVRMAEKYVHQAIEFILSSEGLGKYSSIYGDVLLLKVFILAETGRLSEAAELYPQAIQLIDINRGSTHPRDREVHNMFASLFNALNTGNESAVTLALREIRRHSRHGII